MDAEKEQKIAKRTATASDLEKAGWPAKKGIDAIDGFHDALEKIKERGREVGADPYQIKGALHKAIDREVF